MRALIAAFSIGFAFAVMPGWAVVDPTILPCPAKDSVVLGHLDADVTGDGGLERVMLMGVHFDEASPYMIDISIDVTDLDSHELFCIRLPKDCDSGYDPKLKAMDFTGDGVPDVFVSLATGGSGGIMNYVVYSTNAGRPKLLLDTSKAVIPKFYGHFLPNYEATISVNDKSQIIDLKDRKKFYDQMGYYDNGDLVKPVKLWGGGYGLITPVDVDNDGVYELRTIQQVKGIANVDTIADITSVLKWENGVWRVVSVEVTKAQ